MGVTASAYFDALNIATFIGLLVAAIALARTLDLLLAGWLGSSAALVVFAVDLGAGAVEATS